jgi:hypothetical protein
MVTGLGAYPTDKYFDPNRPIWLPYWLDTNEESAMKYGFYPGVSMQTQYEKYIKPVSTPGAPETAQDFSSWDVPKQEASSKSRWDEWAKDPYYDLPQDPRGIEGGLGPIGWVMLGLGAFLLVKVLD